MPAETYCGVFRSARRRREGARLAKHPALEGAARHSSWLQPLQLRNRNRTCANNRQIPRRSTDQSPRGRGGRLPGGARTDQAQLGLEVFRSVGVGLMIAAGAFDRKSTGRGRAARRAAQAGDHGQREPDHRHEPCAARVLSHSSSTSRPAKRRTRVSETISENRAFEIICSDGNMWMVGGVLPRLVFRRF
jgi:hypothetical protein